MLWSPAYPKRKRTNEYLMIAKSLAFFPACVIVGTRSAIFLLFYKSDALVPGLPKAKENSLGSRHYLMIAKSLAFFMACVIVGTRSAIFLLFYKSDALVPGLHKSQKKTPYIL